MSQNPHPETRPAIHHRYRDDGWTADVQRKFIHALAACGSVVEACRVANRSASSAYRLRAKPEAQAFRDAWAAATAMAYRQVFELAMDRAVIGVEQPVYHNGEHVGFKTTHSDRLLCYLLGHLRPAAPSTAKVEPAHRDRHDYDLAAALSELPSDLDEEMTDEAAAMIDAEGIAMMDWRDEIFGPQSLPPPGPTAAEWDAMTDDQKGHYYSTGEFGAAAAEGEGVGVAAAGPKDDARVSL